MALSVTKPTLRCEIFWSCTRCSLDPAWSMSVSRNEFARLQDAIVAVEKPFCRSPCGYVGKSKIIAMHKTADPYTGALGYAKLNCRSVISVTERALALP